MLANPCAAELVDVELDEVVVVVRLTVPVVNAPASVVRGLLTKLLTGSIQWPLRPFFILNLRVPGDVLRS